MFEKLKIAIVMVLIITSPLATYHVLAETTQIEWLKFDDGYNKIFTEGKPLLVYFNTKVCGWCRKMEKNTFSDPKISETMKQNFILSNVDLRSFEEVKWKGETFTEREISQIFRIVGVPCVAFVDTAGEFIIKIPGYLPPQNFHYVLKYVYGYWYENLTFDEFMKTEEMLNPEPNKR